MSDTLVKVENVSKKFCRSLKKSLWYGMQDLGNELLGRRHGGADACPVQPPLLLVGEALEAVEVDLLPSGQRQFDLPDLKPVPGGDRCALSR